MLSSAAGFRESLRVSRSGCGRYVCVISWESRRFGFEAVACVWEDAI